MLSSPVLGWLLASSAAAQIMPDSTLGAESSQVLSDIEGDGIERIAGGASRGSNLFHSFAEFNVGELQSVYFVSPAGIDAILNRVTGENGSNIFGTLGVEGAADLFFINPNGIVFGENAFLDIEGSFYATTGNAIALGSDVFSATQPEQSRLISVRPGVLLEDYLSNASGDITSTGQLSAEENLSLAANRLNLQGQIASGNDLTLTALEQITIRDSVTTPFVASSGSDLVIQGNELIDIFALNNAESALSSYGDMILRSDSVVVGDAQYLSGGDFRVEKFSEELNSLSSPNDPIIRSLGNVFIGDYVGDSLHIIAAGRVFVPGTVRITGADGTETSIQETVTLSNEETILIDGGQVATLDVRAGVLAENIGLPLGLTGSGSFPSGGGMDDSPVDADIRIGNVIVEEPNGLVFLTNQYFPNEALTPSDIIILGQGISRNDSTFPVLGIDARGFSGLGSQVVVDARGNFLLDDGARIDTSSEISDAGDIDLIAQQEIFLDLGARVSAMASAAAGGDISLAASDIELNANAIVLSSGEDGNISLDGNRLTMQPLSFLISDANGTSGSGEVSISMNESINITGGSLGTFNSLNSSGDSGNISIQTGILTFQGILLEVIPGEPMGFGNISSDIGGTGSAGDIRIEADRVSVLDGAQIRADLLETSNSVDSRGGDITLIVSDLLEVDGFLSDNDTSRISTNARPGTTGRGGDIKIEAGRVRIRNGAQIQAGTFGDGQGGDIFVESTGSLAISDNINDNRLAGIFSGPEGGQSAGNSGDIVLRAEEIAVDGVESFISNGAGFETLGNSGSIGLFARILRVEDGAIIETATSGLGDGGDIDIATTDSFSIFDSFVTTEATGISAGNAGNLTIDSQRIAIENSVIAASTDGVGGAGNILINADDSIALDEATVTASTFASSEGDAGNLSLVSGFIDLKSSSLATSSDQFSSGGNIDIDFSDSIRLRDSRITTSAPFSTGGDISINAEMPLGNGIALLLGDTDITTDSSGDGGDIILNSVTIAFDDSDIITRSENQRGGDITIGPFFPQTLPVDSSAPFDGNGRVNLDAGGATAQGQIVTPDTSIIETSLNELNAALPPVESLTAGSCIARAQADGESSFTVTGAEAIPQQPGSSTISLYPTNVPQNALQEERVTGVIQESENVYQLADGRWVLSHDCSQ